MSEQSQTISQTTSQTTIHNPRRWTIVGLSLLVIVFFALSPTSSALGKMDTVGLAVCHRIPERSFFFGGQQFPLCARCSGTFLGVLLTLITLTLAGRSRASRLPPPRVLAVLVSFSLSWAVDGFNSFLTLYPGAPHLYEPQNWLRLTTGTLHGLAMGTLVFSIFNFSVWRVPRPRPVIQNGRELAGLVGLAALLVGLVLSGDERLFYPLALASTLGVITMLASTNAVIVLIVARRENSAQRWRDVAWPWLVALAVSLALVMGISAARVALTGTLALPL